MKLFFIFILIWTHSAFSQDLTQGLRVNDLGTYPMETLEKPGYLQTVVDPSFGTIIRRITNAGSGNIIAPMYSTIQPWNADESFMIVYEVGKGHQLLDGKNYQFIRMLDDVNPDDIEQLFWDTTNSDLFYYVDRATGELIGYTVSSQEKNAIIDLKAAVNCTDISLGNDVQMPSRDGTVFSFRCGNEKAYYYNLGTNDITEFDIEDLNFTAPMPGPSGTLFYHNKNVYGSDGKFLRTLDVANGNEHASLGQLTNGNDAYFSVVFAGTGCQGNITAHDMVTGDCLSIISQDIGYPYSQSGTHISALAYQNNESGWMAASMIGYDKDGQQLLDQELVIANSDPSNPKVCRIAHHRSDEDDPGFDYWGEPHAAISPSGTRVLFGSDWSGPEDGQSIDSYVVELPAYEQNLSTQNFSQTIANLAPNPFTDKTTLTIKNSTSKLHELMIYDLQGQLIKTIVSVANNEMIITNEKMQKGLYIYTCLLYTSPSPRD